MARTTGGKKKSTPSSTKSKSSSSPSSHGKKAVTGKSTGKETYQKVSGRASTLLADLAVTGTLTGWLASYGMFVVRLELKEEYPDWTGTQRRDEVSARWAAYVRSPSSSV
ncbi:hypothetical protein NBRC10513v2_003105 [Rhodotorula toruloides]